MKSLRKNGREVNVPASSLADIAFLLIIFFMVATLFNTAKGLRFDLPKKDSKPKKITRNEVVIVELNDKGEISIDGSLTKEKDVENVLKEIKKRAPGKAMIFQVSRTCTYGLFATLASRLRLAGFARFAIKGVN